MRRRSSVTHDRCAGERHGFRDVGDVHYGQRGAIVL